MTMLSDFLKENAISPEDLAARSSVLETHHVTEFKLKAKRNQARSQKKTYAELNIEKPKSLGRGVSAGAIKRAMNGAQIPRLVRKKITRAVNQILASKKAEPADWRKLFADVPSKKGEKKKK